MTEKFEVGQRVIAVEDANYLSIGDIGTIHSIDSIYVDVKLDNDTEEFPWLHRRFQALDEYPMDYTTAFKALIDGKMVEDEQGCILRFSKVDMRFQCRTETGNFINVDTVPSNVKFKEYVATPKFTKGQFVECNGSYLRISQVTHNSHGELVYGLTSNPTAYQETFGSIYRCEEEIKEVAV